MLLGVALGNNPFLELFTDGLREPRDTGFREPAALGEGHIENIALDDVVS